MSLSHGFECNIAKENTTYHNHAIPIFILFFLFADNFIWFVSCLKNTY